MWLEAVRDRRAAIIARGNSEVEFSRAACLEVNEVAAELAAQAGGMAAQALPSGQGPGMPSGLAQALPSGQGMLLGECGMAGVVQALPLGAGAAEGQVMPCGKAVYWLPEGPKVVS